MAVRRDTQQQLDALHPEIQQQLVAAQAIVQAEIAAAHADAEQRVRDEIAAAEQQHQAVLTTAWDRTDYQGRALEDWHCGDVRALDREVGALCGEHDRLTTTYTRTTDHYRGPARHRIPRHRLGRASTGTT
jgi:hypothetical protein